MPASASTLTLSERREEASALCRRCRVEKPLSEFYVRSDTGLPYRQCKDCMRAVGKARYERDPEYFKQRTTRLRNTPGFKEKKANWEKNRRLRDPELYASQQRNSYLKCVYGITLEDFERMFEEQLGLCFLCRVDDAEHVDHDHETNIVRGLLCGRCNKALGLFYDNPEVMRRAADYVEMNRAGI